jgi:hypothetical protein
VLAVVHKWNVHSYICGASSKALSILVLQKVALNYCVTLGNMKTHMFTAGTDLVHPATSIWDTTLKHDW